MTTYNVLTIKNQSDIMTKAKNKSDGVYTFRGIDYKVKDGKVVMFAVNQPGMVGEFIKPFGNFNAVVGNFDTNEQKKQGLKNA